MNQKPSGGCAVHRFFTNWKEMNTKLSQSDDKVRKGKNEIRILEK
jgi:hypothetical protein